MTTLLIASPGGHLRQMWTLQPRFGLGGEVVWATSPSEQSRSLLAGQQVIDLPHTPSRDLPGAMRLYASARRAIAEHGITRMVSTGALPAVPFFLAGRRRGIPCHYIESAARYEGPSLSGRIVSRIPGVDLYCQYPNWATGRWKFRGSVLDGFEPGPVQPGSTGRGLRVVVTVGVEQFSFRRAIERLIEILPADAEVTWQTGFSDVSGLAIDAHDFIPASVLETAMREADVVVAHSGAGSALTAMSVGKKPLLLPRRASQREHVDDHQLQIARELERRGVAAWVEVADLELVDLVAAAAGCVVRVEPPGFALVDASQVPV